MGGKKIWPTWIKTYGWKPRECTLNRQQRKQYQMLCTAAIFQNLERMKMKKFVLENADCAALAG